MGKLTKDFDGSPDAGDEEGHVEHPAEGLELGEELDGGVRQELDQRRGQDDGASHDLVAIEWIQCSIIFINPFCHPWLHGVSSGCDPGLG